MDLPTYCTYIMCVRTDSQYKRERTRRYLSKLKKKKKKKKKTIQHIVTYLTPSSHLVTTTTNISIISLSTRTKRRCHHIKMKRMFRSPKTTTASSISSSISSKNDRIHTNSRSPTKKNSEHGPNSPTITRTVKPQEKREGGLKTHIEVCARIRPLRILKERDAFFSSPKRKMLPSVVKSKKKKAAAVPSFPTTAHGEEFVAWDVNNEGDTAAQSQRTEHVQGRTHAYTLDTVYGIDSTTRHIYDQSVHSIVKAAMEGYHSSVLAYGQTSTGKTFTMSGTKESPGLIPLCIRDCFRYVKESQESREYLIRISYLEVYKEHIQDLLATTPVPVRLFDGPNGLIIKGLKEEVATSPEQVFSILKKGETRRQVGATHMNQHSSRSHVMVRLWIESTGTDTGLVNGAKKASARVSSLSLVDLAGSESVRLNGTDRREEGHYINKSLMTLGQVVLSLSENKTGHIPYRDSKLTRLLQPSLSGNAQMVLLCCISPQLSFMEESHNTFKFATRAKKIEQKATINISSDETTLLQNYREEIEDLKKQLAEAKEQQRLLQEKTEQAKANNNSKEAMEAEVEELVEAITTMEQLILKSRPHKATVETDSEIDLLAEEDTKDEYEDLLMNDSPPKTPEMNGELTLELSRVRGLLGSVLQKRGVTASVIDPPAVVEGESKVERVLDFGVPASPRSPRICSDDREVETLRKQLVEQELVTSLRKADSSFLQSQLLEKDMLLEEVSKILEAVEKRQLELEKENAALRAENSSMRSRYALL